MEEIVLTEPERLDTRQATPCRDLVGGEVRVRVRRVGVCGTDIHAFYGRQPFFTYPRVLGHELAVEVMEIADDVSRLSPGMLCAVEPYLNDRHSQASKRGKTNCLRRTPSSGCPHRWEECGLNWSFPQRSFTPRRISASIKSRSSRRYVSGHMLLNEAGRKAETSVPSSEQAPLGSAAQLSQKTVPV